MWQDTLISLDADVEAKLQNIPLLFWLNALASRRCSSFQLLYLFHIKQKSKHGKSNVA
jgi:hypothetical protein